MAYRLRSAVSFARACSATASAYVTRTCSPASVQNIAPCCYINQPCRWLGVRFNSHWLVTLKFPEPQPTREEKIATFERTLANVVGSMEEAKKRIYVVSTTNYTGFKCELPESLTETLEKQPGVTWVLPDCYADPQYRPYGPGDRYNNGVITPDPNANAYNRPSERYNDRPMNRRRDPLPTERTDRKRDFQATDGRGQDYRGPPMGGGRGPMPPREQQDNRPLMSGGRGPMPPREQEDNKPPMDGRGPLPPRDQHDYRSPMAERGPMQGERRDYMPSREPMQGQQEAMGPQGRDPVQGTN